MSIPSSSASRIFSVPLVSKLMTTQQRTTDYGRYGNLAANHMAQWLPMAFASIPAEETEGYFRALDNRVVDAIGDLEVSLTPPKSLQQTDFLAYSGQMQMSHLMAEEQVLAELVYLAPELGTEPEEPETDRDGTFIDLGWTPPRAAESGFAEEFEESPTDR